jgi:DNA-binding NarL/FixJ family response regulator
VETRSRDGPAQDQPSETPKETALDSSIVSTLLVDDYADWRRFISSMLLNRTKISIVGEASTGLEAVQKAHQLQPDLILMDIGLPTLNGIEAAREIRSLSPMSKILFVSQTTSPDIAEEAFRAGAAGFLAKSDVAKELIPAVRAVLEGKRFVSGSLRSDVLADVEDSYARKQDQSEESFEALPIEKPGGRHEVKFYSDDADFVAGFAGVAEEAIKAGHAVVIIATESHRVGVFQELEARGVDVRAAIQNGNYRSQDAKQTIENIMVHGVLDSVRCAKFMGEMVAQAAKCATVGHPLVVICGEGAPTLLATGDSEGAIRLEHLWDRLTKVYDADTLCGYLGSAFSDEADKPILERICAEHSVVYR